MKKIISLLLALSLALNFAACGSNTESPDGSSNNHQQTGTKTPDNTPTDKPENTETPDASSDHQPASTKTPDASSDHQPTSTKTPDNTPTSQPESTETPDNTPTSQPEISSEKLGVFNKNATIEETVMVDENGVKITATGLSYTNYSVKLDLMIENNTDQNLSFVSGSMGYSCNSVNGYIISDGYLSSDVIAGKKANSSISFSYDGLMLYGINEIADMEIGFSISDDDYNYTYTGPRQIKTSAFASYDYSTNHYQLTITSHAAMNTYKYDMKYFSQDMLYDESGVKLVSSGIMVNRDGDTILLLELENTTSSIVKITTSDIALNGLLATSSTWSRDTINPGKHCIIDVNLSSVLDTEYWSIFGINEVGFVSLSLNQYDADDNSIAVDIPVEIIVPGAKIEYDSTGEEIYNKDGLKIIAKAILDDPFEYSSDIHILLLAENNSGKTLLIDDVYDSLSVNGFMTDYFYYSKKIKHGESAVLEIELWESSLEDNKIESVSDIKEIEIGFEIKEGSNTIDKPVVKISFN